MLISDDYRALNKQLHEDRADYGTSSGRWVVFLNEMMKDGRFPTMLDWGCGKGKLKIGLVEKGIAPERIREFDPAIEGKDATPEPADMVCCNDVLEHIEPVHLNAVLRELHRVTKQRLFVSIATAPSVKTLADGRNAHLIVKPAAWWRQKLLQHFRILNWEQRGRMVIGELGTKPHVGVLKVRARRRLNTEIISMFEGLKSDINAVSDIFSQIKTWRSWEGLDDEPSDLTGCLEVLETVDDVDAALADIARCSLKATCIGIQPSEDIPEADWKRWIEKRFRVGRYYELGSKFVMLGSPGMQVEGITAVGAGGEEMRWEQAKAACKRFEARIECAPEHGRRAILACYGPSLVDTIDQLKAAVAEGNCDVISVSGSHDFLIANGIVPRWHIECDPRPHKTNNLEKPHPDVEYLIASCVHSNYFDKLEAHGAKVRLWHVSSSENLYRLQQELGEHREHIISGGGSVGLRSVPLLYAMGFRIFSIFAMDCSFKDEGKEQWAGKHAGKRQDIAQVLCGDVIYYSSPILLTYATNFFEMMQKAPDIDVRLYGNGLLQHMVAMHMHDVVATGQAPGVQQARMEEEAA